MTTARRTIVCVVGVTALLTLVGCGPDPKDLQIQTLMDKNNDLERENANLRDRYALAIRERDQCRSRAYDLEQQVADLRAMLAQRPEGGAAGWVQSGAWSWIDLGTDILFDSGRATLKPGARDKLRKVVQDIREYYPGKMVWVVGHTDNDPIKKTKHLWKDNLDLSANRAMTVYRELQELGIDAERMIAGGQGDHNPIASNATKAGKAQNRRVQVVAVPPPDATGTPAGTPGAMGDLESEPASTERFPREIEK